MANIGDTLKKVPAKLNTFTLIQTLLLLQHDNFVLNRYSRDSNCDCVKTY